MIESPGDVGVLHKVIGGLPGAVGTSTSERDRTTKAGLWDRRLVEAAVERFLLITKLDELWNADVARGRLAYDEADEREITGLYRRWLAEAEAVATGCDLSALDPHDASRAAQLAIFMQDARGICTPDEEFFAGPALEDLADRAIAAHRAGETVEIRNPRR